MFKVGDWVEFSYSGKTLKGFVIYPNIFGSTIETVGDHSQVGKSYQKISLNIPNYQIQLLSDEILPQDKEMIIDMSLASKNNALFNSLTSP